jgi:hypothetical protein
MNSLAWSIGALWIIFFTPFAVAQNLVPNGSFEEYTICPDFSGYVQYATGWENLHTNSADYFNRCQTNLIVGVPFNHSVSRNRRTGMDMWGWQPPSPVFLLTARWLVVN